MSEKASYTSCSSATTPRGAPSPAASARASRAARAAACASAHANAGIASNASNVARLRSTTSAKVALNAAHTGAQRCSAGWSRSTTKWGIGAICGPAGGGPAMSTTARPKGKSKPARERLPNFCGMGVGKSSASGADRGPLLSLSDATALLSDDELMVLREGFRRAAAPREPGGAGAAAGFGVGARPRPPRRPRPTARRRAGRRAVAVGRGARAPRRAPSGAAAGAAAAGEKGLRERAFVENVCAELLPEMPLALARALFGALDRRGAGALTADELVVGVAVLARGDATRACGSSLT